MLPATLINLLSSALTWIYPEYQATARTRPLDTPALRFELRHTHAVSPSARVVWADVPQTNYLSPFAPAVFYAAQTRSVKRSKPVSQDAFLRARSLSRLHRQSVLLDWEEDEVTAPDVESRETLLELAKMTNNAYLEPNEEGWYDLGGDWNVVSSAAGCSCFPTSSVFRMFLLQTIRA
jgi:lipase ATG15